VGLALRREAERLVKADRAAVDLVRIELDPRGPALAGARERGKHQRAAETVAACAFLDEEVLEPAVLARGPNRMAEAQLANARRRSRRGGRGQEELGA
jgi:hypothetical protein